MDKNLNRFMLRFEKMNKMYKDTAFIGKTTLRDMLCSYKNDERVFYSECGGAELDFKGNPEVGDDEVYVYYHSDIDATIMTTVLGDKLGIDGSSIGLDGLLTLDKKMTLKEAQELAKKPSIKLYYFNNTNTE